MRLFISNFECFIYEKSSILVQCFSSPPCILFWLDIIWWKWCAHLLSAHCVSDTVLHFVEQMFLPGCFAPWDGSDKCNEEESRAREYKIMCEVMLWVLHSSSDVCTPNVKLTGVNVFTHLWSVMHCPLLLWFSYFGSWPKTKMCIFVLENSLLLPSAFNFWSISKGCKQLYCHVFLLNVALDCIPVHKQQQKSTDQQQQLNILESR